MPRGGHPFHASGTAAAGGTGSTGFGTVVGFTKSRVVTKQLDIAAAAVDVGSGLVGIPVTSHEFSVGDEVVIVNTVNYNGTFIIKAIAANQADITATYVAEVFAAADTMARTTKRQYTSKDVAVKSTGGGEALYFSFDNRQTWAKLDEGSSWSGAARAHKVVVGSVGGAGTYEIAASLI